MGSQTLTQGGWLAGLGAWWGRGGAAGCWGAIAELPCATPPRPSPHPTCREDLKHLKQKLKKLEEKAGKDGAKAADLAVELARLQEDVPALQARAADLELQLTKAQEVRYGLWGVVFGGDALKGGWWESGAGAGWRLGAVVCCQGLCLPQSRRGAAADGMHGWTRQPQPLPSLPIPPYPSPAHPRRPTTQVRAALEEGIRGEVEGYRAQLEGVKAELAPWEAQMAEVQARIGVAASERDLLAKQHEDAKTRLADTQVALRAAQETAANKGGQIREMEASVDKYRCAVGGCCWWVGASSRFGESGRALVRLHRQLQHPIGWPMAGEPCSCTA